MDETARVRDLLERVTVPEPPVGPMVQNALRAGVRRRRRRRAQGIAAAAAVVVAVAASTVTFGGSRSASSPAHASLPPVWAPNLGVSEAGSPPSYQPVEKFTAAAGVKPGLVEYDSGWGQPFAASYARTIRNHGAVVIVQMDPADASVAGIAAGQYDGYLSSYAESVRAYRYPVVLSFGHEMNGTWYSWGYGRTSPAVFVAAWRHIVKLFHALGVQNVTWMWTVSVIDDTEHGKVSSPNRWWPGSSYVNWVGIDGYYLKPSWIFAPLFGPTIAAVRTLTADPILIAGTGVVPAAGQPAKITDLFAGIRQYGLRGFVYFDTDSGGAPFAITSPAAIAALRRGASTYQRPHKRSAVAGRGEARRSSGRARHKYPKPCACYWA
jgi:mannan endo-1,4-beta-mannosidase